MQQNDTWLSWQIDKRKTLDCFLNLDFSVKYVLAMKNCGNAVACNFVKGLFSHCARRDSKITGTSDDSLIASTQEASCIKWPLLIFESRAFSVTIIVSSVSFVVSSLFYCSGEVAIVFGLKNFNTAPNVRNDLLVVFAGVVWLKERCRAANFIWYVV